MGLEAVVEEIREKGKKEADKIRAESKQETDKILAAAGKRAGEIKLAAEAESAKQTTHIIEQEASAANLLVKRELLNTQKALLDKVYETVPHRDCPVSLKASIVKPSKNSSPRRKRRSHRVKFIAINGIWQQSRLLSPRLQNLPNSKSGHLSISTGEFSWKVKEENCRLITVTARSLQKCGNPG